MRLFFFTLISIGFSFFAFAFAFASSGPKAKTSYSAVEPKAVGGFGSVSTLSLSAEVLPTKLQGRGAEFPEILAGEAPLILKPASGEAPGKKKKSIKTWVIAGSALGGVAVASVAVVTAILKKGASQNHVTASAQSAHEGFIKALAKSLNKK